MENQIKAILTQLNNGVITTEQAASHISSIVVNYAFEKDQRASEVMQLAFTIVLSPDMSVL